MERGNCLGLGIEIGATLGESFDEIRHCQEDIDNGWTQGQFGALSCNKDILGNVGKLDDRINAHDARSPFHGVGGSHKTLEKFIGAVAGL